jgi:hypothetical protein
MARPRLVRVRFRSDGFPRYALLRAQPFEAAIAVLVFVQGVLGLSGVGPPVDILPPWWKYTVLAMYTLGGAAIFAGLAFVRGDIEALGLILLGTTVLSRGLVIANQLGWGIDAMISITFAVVLAGACFTRLRTLLPGGRELIVPTTNHREE